MTRRSTKFMAVMPDFPEKKSEELSNKPEVQAVTLTCKAEPDKQDKPLIKKLVRRQAKEAKQRRMAFAGKSEYGEKQKVKYAGNGGKSN